MVETNYWYLYTEEMEEDDRIYKIQKIQDHAFKKILKFLK